MLQETVSEMGRNGCRKILIASGHGGNTNLLNYFLQTQLDSPKDYVVYGVSALGGGTQLPPAAQPSRPGVDGHAGENEAAMVMASRPELVHPERGAEQSGANFSRVSICRRGFSRPSTGTRCIRITTLALLREPPRRAARRWSKPRPTAWRPQFGR
jgi:creatinine amidohydrolase/Fe(II)-dependent formamide hydrolase-like protein